MEILQTIWTALTTSNEELIQIISIPLTFLEFYLYMLLFTTILNVPKTKKQSIIYLLSISIISILLNNFILKIYSGFLLLVIHPLLLITIFKVNILKAIIAEIFPQLICVVGEILITKIYESLFHIDVLTLSIVPLYRISSVLFIYLLMFCIYRVCKRFSLNIALLDSMDKKSKILFSINIFIAIIAIGAQSFLACFYSENLPIAITLLGIFSLLTYFFTSLYSISRSTKLELTEQSLEEAKLYNKSLKILHDNVRAFKHDFSNIVQAIGRIYWYK